MTYEIGYRRPPPASRFKKGSSGNPKGRPRGSKNFLTLLEKELSQTIVVSEHGKKKSITRMQAMVKRLVANSLQGDPKGLLTLVEILRRTGGMEPTEVQSLLPDNYQEILQAYVETQRKAGTPAAQSDAISVHAPPTAPIKGAKS